MGSIELVDPQMAQVFQAMYETIFYLGIFAGSLILAIVIAVNPVLQKIVFGIVCAGASFLTVFLLFANAPAGSLEVAMLTAAFVIIIYDLIGWCRCRG